MNHEHVVRHLPLIALPLVGAALWFQVHYTIGLNVTPSLPYRLFVIHKGERPARGDFVAFRWPGGGPYAAGATFVKEIAGLPGDVVTRRERSFFVNGVPVGEAKTQSLAGETLEPGPTGIVPADAYYVRAPHPDSLDSRYALLGWVAQSTVIGRAYALF